MEALSCMFSKAGDLGIINGVKLPFDDPSISHLFYSDDAIILGEWDRDVIHNVVRILKCFHVCSGLQINFGKCNIFGLGVNLDEIEEMAFRVGCKAESFPFKYLGLTVGANMNRINNWRPVFDIFEKRLSMWKASLLSIGGRVTLFRSVLESLPSYFFSLYRAPVIVIEGFRKFLWEGSSSEKKLHWVAWDRVASPKKMGGLSLHNLKDINMALFSKRGWRLKTKRDNLWVHVVNVIHSGGSGWNSFPAKKAYGGVRCNIVFVLNKPVVGNIPLRNFFRGVVGNDESILFWLGPWLYDVPLKEKFPDLFRLEMVKNCSIRDRLDGEGLWLLRHDFESDPERSEWHTLDSVMGSVSRSNLTNRWKWMGSGSDVFSVAAVKRLIVSKKDYSSRYLLD
ncbi:uncharacterized protein LOC110901200 [Helianthus annuus]|uniref:uncharacterized protein LOC110901200 n=1 Tax=Helianthus annuus TaxID=4232 RepID=UPI000B8F3840|nr:uncharacterized protein LOC110901200 [Helianthus annuus]